ncbi:MAG: hypothetical protein H3C47_04870, partial [Candidatus Cloacimonetes bacterium]|nr:hypothetical protein [Candidatus Cloacimonadota bacterium]
GIASSDEDEEFDSSDFEGLSESEPESEPESSSDSHGSDSDMEFDLDLGIASSDEDEEFDTGDFEELPDPMQQEMLAEGYLLEEADEVEPVTETVSLLELSEDLDERKEVLEFIESQGILDTLSQSVAEVEEFEPTPKVEPVVAESIQVQNEGFNYFDIASRLSEETLRALKNIEAVTWNPPQPELVEEPEVESTVLPDWLQTQLVELSSMKQAQEMAARLHLEHRANLDQIVEVLREGGFAHLILLAELLLSSEEPVDEIETIALYHSALKVMPEALETLRLEILLRLWEMAPLNQQLILNIASLYRKLNQNQQRESFLISAIEKMIDHARFREARYLFQLCTKEGFESEIFCRVGVRLYSGCQDDESLLLYLDRVEMLHGSHIDWELQRKDALIRMGKLVEALHSLKQCLTLSDEPVPVLEEIVSLMRRLAKRQEVLPYINQLLSLDPHNSLAEEMLAWAKPVEVKPVTIETPVLAEDSLRNLESRLEAMLEKKLSSLKVGREIPVQSEVIHEFEEKSIEESHLPNETLVSDAINFEEFESSNQDKQEHVKRDLDWEEVRLELPPTILRKLKEMEEWERKLSVNHDLSQEDSLIILGNLQELILGAEKMPEKIRRRYCDLGRNLSRNLADPMLAFFWTSEFQKLS